MQNSRLRNKVKQKKKILVKVIKTACFLHELFSIYNESTPNDSFFLCKPKTYGKT